MSGFGLSCKGHGRGVGGYFYFFKSALNVDQDARAWTAASHLVLDRDTWELQIAVEPLLLGVTREQDTFHAGQAGSLGPHVLCSAL